MNPLTDDKDRDLCDRLAQTIPGFQGYMDPEHRNESEQFARTWLGQKLEAVKHNIDRHLATLVDQGQLGTLAPGERLKKRIETLRGTIRSEAATHSDFFSCDESALNQLQQMEDLELSLLTNAQAIEDTSVELSEQTQASEEGLRQLSQAIERLADQFAQRDQALHDFTA